MFAPCACATQCSVSAFIEEAQLRARRWVAAGYKKRKEAVHMSITFCSQWSHMSVREATSDRSAGTNSHQQATCNE